MRGETPSHILIPKAVSAPGHAHRRASMHRFMLLFFAACCHAAFGDPQNAVWSLPGPRHNSGLRMQGDIDAAKRESLEVAEQLKAKEAELVMMNAAVGRAAAEKALVAQKYEAAATADRHQYTDIREKIRGLVSARTALEAEAVKGAEEGRKQMEALDAETAKQASQVQVLMKEKEALTAQVGAVLTEIQSLSGKTKAVAGLANENKRMEVEIQSAADKEEQQQQLIDQLNEELAALQKNLDDHEKKTASLYAEHAILKERNKELRDAVAKATAEKDDVQKVLQSIPQST